MCIVMVTLSSAEVVLWLFVIQVLFVVITVFLLTTNIKLYYTTRIWQQPIKHYEIIDGLQTRVNIRHVPGMNTAIETAVDLSIFYFQQSVLYYRCHTYLNMHAPQ
jgi:hypothetical protein